jgi:predicted ATPase
LNLRGEWTFEVQGLPVPAHDQVEGLEDYSAVELFVQSARRARMSFELRVEERPYLARICRLVEGMPLGIELAAAWAQVLSCREIAQEIERGLEFLSTSARDVPERHRSMRAVFDHSWALLSDRERQVLRRLSVFRGGFRRAAAETVAGADLPLLAALAAKSLLRCTSTGRYDLHELVRQYAADHLHTDPDEESDTRDRHGVYYTELVAQLEGSLKGERQPEALADVGAEIDNVRDAWRWAVTRGQVAAIQRTVKGLWLFYEIRGWFEEAEAAFRWAGEELDRTNDAQEVPDPSLGVLREFIRANQGWFCLDLGRLQDSQGLLQTSLIALRASGAGAELQDALHHAGLLEWFIGSYARSRANFLEELALATQREDPWAIARARGNIGMVAHAMGEYEEALEQMQASVADFRRLGDQRMVASALHFLGALECTLGAYDQARAHLSESLALSGTIDDRWIQGLALGQLGYVARAVGEHAEAVRLFQESLVLVREFGEGWSMTQSLNGLGATTLAMGAYGEARSAFLEALALAREIQAWPEALDALAGLANWSAQNGEPEAALAQVVLVRDHPATKQETRAQATQLGTELTTQLTRQQIAAVEARTQAQSFDAVATELLAASLAGPL